MGGKICKRRGKDKKKLNEEAKAAGVRASSQIDNIGGLGQNSGINLHTGPKMIKIVLVGDNSVGKSALIRNYLYNDFSDEYEPTVLDVFKGTKNIVHREV